MFFNIYLSMKMRQIYYKYPKTANLKVKER